MVLEDAAAREARPKHRHGRHAAHTVAVARLHHPADRWQLRVQRAADKQLDEFELRTRQGAAAMSLNNPEVVVADGADGTDFVGVEVRPHNAQPHL